MKALKIIAFVVLVLFVAVAALGLLAPKQFAVERSIVIEAPREVVFEHVKYWRNWSAWSPWTERDSTMSVSVEGTDGEIGSKYVWSGDPKVTGQGEMTNTGVSENQMIDFHIQFIEPWPSHSDGSIRLAGTEQGTVVKWEFHGENPFPWNIIMLFMSMDKMVGPDYERGLSLLKAIVEGEQRANAGDRDEV